MLNKEICRDCFVRHFLSTAPREDFPDLTTDAQFEAYASARFDQDWDWNRMLLCPATYTPINTRDFSYWDDDDQECRAAPPPACFYSLEQLMSGDHSKAE
jgi:hypothetical protein